MGIPDGMSLCIIGIVDETASHPTETFILCLLYEQASVIQKAFVIPIKVSTLFVYKYLPNMHHLHHHLLSIIDAFDESEKIINLSLLAYFLVTLNCPFTVK